MSVYGYLRVSTDDQDENSQKIQKAIFDRKCKQLTLF